MSRNVIAPNAEETTAEQSVDLTVAVSKFKYEKSVDRLTPKVAKWKGLTVEIARELYLAREWLNGQKGQRKDPDAPDYIEHTWAEYCDTVGVSRQTANGWLRLFVPAEISGDGQDLLLAPEDLKVASPEQNDDAKREQEKRIAYFKSHGIRPDGWTKSDETELKIRLATEKAKKTAALWMGKSLDISPRRDYFGDVLAKAKDIKKFRLETPEQNHAQQVTFDALDDYLRSFSTMNTRLLAAVNLSIRLKEVVNYYAEMDTLNGNSGEDGAANE